MKKLCAVFIILILAASFMSFSFNGIKYTLGGKVTGLELKDLYGKVFNLDKVLAEDDVRGVVFVFLSYKCPASKASDERYVSYAAKYKQKGIIFVGINSNSTENIEDMKKWAVDKKYNFPVLWDEGNVIADRFDAKTTPHVFFVDKDAFLSYKGCIDDNTGDASKVKKTFLADTLEAYLSGDDIIVVQTRPDG